MSTNLDQAHELYDALTNADAERLLSLLHTDFCGEVSDGMPMGVGGVHVGPTAMLRDVWVPIARRYAARPVPERFLTCESGEVVVLGHYQGQPPGGNDQLCATFAHVLRFRDDRIAELLQITDTKVWADAAPDPDIEVVKRMFDSVRCRDASALLNSYAIDIEIREPAELPYGGVYHGHDGAIRHALGFTKCWDAIQSEHDRDMEPEILPAGNHVMVLWRLKATAPERRIDTPVIDVIKLRDRQVVSLHMFHRDPSAVREFLDSTTTN